MNRFPESTSVMLCGLFFVSLLPGCSNPDRKNLAPLFDEIQAEVTGKLRPEITALPTPEERSYTMFRDLYRDQYNIIVEYIDSEPKLSDSTMQLVVQWRDATRQVYDYYDQFVSNQNFALTESEREHGKTLMQNSLSLLIELENIATGDK